VGLFNILFPRIYHVLVKATSHADNKIVVATNLCEWGFVKEINLSKNDQFYYMSCRKQPEFFSYELALRLKEKERASS
jgi:hypothetical protein